MKNRKISVLFADELKTHMFAFSLAAIILEIFLIYDNGKTDISKDFFNLSVIAFFFLYSAIGYVFEAVVGNKTAEVFSLLPAFVLYFMVKNSSTWSYLKYVIIIAALLRILIVFLPYKKIVLTYGCFAFDAAALILYFAFGRLNGETLTDKLLFVFLVLMTLSAFQRHFPFYYFVILGLIISLIPMGEKPIDWSVLVQMGERIAEKADEFSYYLPYSFNDNSYTAGYSSFNIWGEKVSENDKDEKTQLILKTSDKPYYIYVNEENNATMKTRRNIYLSGGVGAEKEQFVRFIHFLYMNGITKEEARLFSQISGITVEYALINTRDEIAPRGSIKLESAGKELESGVGDKVHRKGYNIAVRFLDIDYGNPYLTELLRKADDYTEEIGGKIKNDSAQEKESGIGKLSFNDATDYVKELYGIELTKVMTEEEYDAFNLSIEEENTNLYLDTDGSSKELEQLADTLTEGISGEYDKCRIIEKYLRQYPYSTNAVGGYDASSDMSSAKGMADIAERFLFDNKKGYCVHFTSSMVMLLRLSGIPARARVGYCYSFPFEQEESYKVSSRCAHIWPEAYIENVGWVPFEPTSGYHALADFTWHRALKEAVSDEDSFSLSQEPELTLTPELSAQEDDETQEDTSVNMAKEAFTVAWPVALSIIVLLALIIAGNILIKALRYKYGSPEEKLGIDVEQIKKLVHKKASVPVSDRGLLSDYVNAVPDEFKADLRIVFAAYYRSVYGNVASPSVTAEENALARKLCIRMKNGLQGRGK